MYLVLQDLCIIIAPFSWTSYYESLWFLALIFRHLHHKAVEEDKELNEMRWVWQLVIERFSAVSHLTKSALVNFLFDLVQQVFTNLREVLHCFISAGRVGHTGQIGQSSKSDELRRLIDLSEDRRKAKWSKKPRESRTSGHWRIEEKQVDKEELSADERCRSNRERGAYSSKCKSRTQNELELRLSIQI